MYTPVAVVNLDPMDLCEGFAAQSDMEVETMKAKPSPAPNIQNRDSSR